MTQKVRTEERSSDKKIHEPGTSWCLGYSHTRRRDTHNNTAQHLNFLRYKTCKTLKDNNGKVLDQIITHEAEEVILLGK